MNHDSALLIGATGLTGRHLLALLIADRRYRRLHVFSRRPLPARNDRLQVHVADFDHLPPTHPAFRVNDVFCCLGTTIRQAGTRERFRRIDYHYPMSIARRTRENGAERYVVMSALGADPDSRNFYLRTKGELERDLEAIGFRQVVAVRPSLLLGSREKRRFLETIGMWVLPKLAFLLQGPLKPYRAIEAAVVARAMLRLAWQEGEGMRVASSHELQRLGTAPAGERDVI